MILRVSFIVGLLAIAACSPPAAPASEPDARHELALSGRVTDAADILSPVQEAALTAKLANLERRKGHQFVVVTTPTLGGETVEAYSLRMANRWGIGRKGYNDGVLLLVAPNERKVRIEVGFGLEATLTDPICAEILKQDVLPRFGAGDLPGGIDAGVIAIVQRLDEPSVP